MGLFNGKQKNLESLYKQKEEMLANIDNVSEKQLLVEILFELKRLNIEIERVQRNQIIWSD